MDRWRLLLHSLGVQDLVQRILWHLQKQTNLEGLGGEQMQSLRVDSCTRKNTHGGQPAKKRVASPRSLHDGPLETCLHLSLLCPFANAVWNQVLTWEHFDTHLMQLDQDPVHLSTWWEETVPKVAKEERKRFNGLWSTHAGIYGRKETEESSIIPRNRLHRLLRELRRTLSKGERL